MWFSELRDMKLFDVVLSTNKKQEWKVAQNIVFKYTSTSTATFPHRRYPAANLWRGIWASRGFIWFPKQKIDDKWMDHKTCKFSSKFCSVQSEAYKPLNISN